MLDHLDIQRSRPMKKKRTYDELENQITELKKQNEILELSKHSLLGNETKLANIYEQAPLAYQALDSNGCFLMINKTWLKTFGYKRDEVIGKWLGDFLAPEFVDSFRKCFSKHKAEVKIHFEFEMIHKSGERRFVVLQGSLSHNSTGEFVHTNCILQDITKRQQAEEALKESKEKLKNTESFIF